MPRDMGHRLCIFIRSPPLSEGVRKGAPVKRSRVGVLVGVTRLVKVVQVLLIGEGSQEVIPLSPGG